ncbi:tRNA1(Val) (adenine(37)-N6)-methyltransferase [Segnochrobactrum spirostomi]|uniref:Methyltransferase n=1 Tax=Segnochrobactrum spirostomi TaxID=2608987 RepID=A0A6A7Y948_9HYPH|nr:methyltransferase [Segnochrobactrum spirostomi]MQT13999.1 methyltransferase [Segnochrobactrum spirostomi]
MNAGGEGPFTRDAFLGGRLIVRQPSGGAHRSGHDAVLLAAAVPAGLVGRLYDLGAGAGVAGLCAGLRAPGLAVDLVERDPAALAAARLTLDEPENAGIVTRARVIEADILMPAAARAEHGLIPGSAAMVVTNPPFHRAGTVRASPDVARAGAHVLGPEGLEPWLKLAAALAAPDGRVAIIFPAAGLKDVLDSLAGRFGAVVVVPVQARADAAAIRIVVTGRKGSRAPLALAPALVLHEPDGRPTAAARAILEDGAPLPGCGVD